MLHALAVSPRTARALRDAGYPQDDAPLVLLSTPRGDRIAARSERVPSDGTTCAAPGLGEILDRLPHHVNLPTEGRAEIRLTRDSDDGDLVAWYAVDGWTAHVNGHALAGPEGERRAVESAAGLWLTLRRLALA